MIKVKNLKFHLNPIWRIKKRDQNKTPKVKKTKSQNPIKKRNPPPKKKPPPTKNIHPKIK
jgi:hypothetical protein